MFEMSVYVLGLLILEGVIVWEKITSNLSDNRIATSSFR